MIDMNNLKIDILKDIRDTRSLFDDLKHKFSCIDSRLVGFSEKIEDINFEKKEADYLTPFNQRRTIGMHKKNNICLKDVADLEEFINKKINYVELKKELDKTMTQIYSKIESLNAKFNIISKNLSE